MIRNIVIVAVVAIVAYLGLSSVKYSTDSITTTTSKITARQAAIEAAVNAE